MPCVRGAGVFQTGVDYCIKMMNNENAWVHIFPGKKIFHIQNLKCLKIFKKVKSQNSQFELSGVYLGLLLSHQLRRFSCQYG